MLGALGLGSGARGAALGWVGPHICRVLGEGADPEQGALQGCNAGMESGRGAVRLGTSLEVEVPRRGSKGTEKRKGSGVPMAPRGTVPGGVAGRIGRDRLRESKWDREPGPGPGRRGAGAGGSAVPAEAAQSPSRSRQSRAAAAPVTTAAAVAAGRAPRDPRTRRRPDVPAHPSARARRLPWRPGKR